MKDPHAGRDNPWKTVALLGFVGFDLVVCMFSGYWLGRGMQSWFGGSPLWIVAGIMIGFAAGVAAIILIIKKESRRNQ
jgi:F0F1-type ATP synthase assembly protein I